MRDGYVHASEMPGVPAEEVSGGWHEARMRCPRNSMRDEEEGEEGTEGERQTTGQHDDSRRSHATDNAVRSTTTRGRKDCKCSWIFIPTNSYTYSCLPYTSRSQVVVVCQTQILGLS